MNEIFIRTVDLPLSVRAFTLPDAQGDYNVYINSGLSPEQMKKTLLHEKMHISGDDFYKDSTADAIEHALGKRLANIT